LHSVKSYSMLLSSCKRVIARILGTLCCSTILWLQVAAQRHPEATVLKIHGIAVTEQEFSGRLNLVPRPNEFDPDSLRREALVASIIGEKILAQEARRLSLDTTAHVRKASKEFEREAVYELWIKNHITDRIKIDDRELRQAYPRFVEQRVVDFAVFRDSASAKTVERRIRGGERLSSMMGLDGSPVGQVKEFEYGEAVRSVEDAIYGLRENEATTIIPVDGKYYIFQLKTARSHPVYSKQDFAYWRLAIEKRLRKRKELDRFGVLMNSLMANKRFRVNKGVYDYVLNEIAKRIPFGNDDLLRIPEAVNREFAAPPEDLQTHFHDTFLQFDTGARWTIGDLWENLCYGPYLLNYRSQDELKNDFSHLLRTMVLINAVVEEGYKERLDSTPYVRREGRMWTDDLLSKAFRQTQSDSGQTIDRLIAARSTEYAVAINKKALQDVEVLKGTMAIRKTHFPNRLAVPVTAPIDYRSSWFQRMWNSQ
jgi:hypothetical protein